VWLTSQAAFEAHETPAATEGRDPAREATVGPQQKVGGEQLQS